jgi:subtilisin family serine protease
MGKEAVYVTRDGFHLAWEGTSASAPFTAGVIALMLEKNPTLDSTQIKRILTQTASPDGLVGATPNAEWGYGRLNPVAALAATPPAPRNDPR